MSTSKLYLSFLVLCVATVSQAYFTPSSLIAYLDSIAGSHTISGQFIELGPIDPIEAIYNNTGKWLGLIGGDYWWYGETDFQGSKSFNDYAIPYAKNGGLITLSNSMPNPTTGGPLYDVSNLDVNGLLQSGTSTNTNLLTILNSVAAGLQDFQNSGVTVIWRPYHEMEGDWFWWGTSFLSDDQFNQLWQYTYNYMTQTMGLNNIVWLWAGNDYLNRYPGDAYVDIVGQDLYTSYPTQGQATYQTMMSTGKLVVISEFGAGGPNGGDLNFNETTLISAIQSTMPNSVFWQQWWDGNAGNVGWGMAEVQGVEQALSDPWVLNRDDLALVNK